MLYRVNGPSWNQSWVDVTFKSTLVGNHESREMLFLDININRNLDIKKLFSNIGKYFKLRKNTILIVRSSVRN